MKGNFALSVVRSANLLYGLYALANGIYVLSGGPYQALAQVISSPGSSNSPRIFAALTIFFSLMIVSGSLYLKMRWGKFLAFAGLFLEFFSWIVEVITLANNHASAVPILHPAHIALLSLLLLIALNSYLLYLIEKIQKPSFKSE